MPRGTAITTDAENTTGGNKSEDATIRAPIMTGNNIIDITSQNVENSTPVSSDRSNTADIVATQSSGVTDVIELVNNSQNESQVSADVGSNKTLSVASVNEPAILQPDDTSNDSSIVNLDRTTVDVITKVSGIITKECSVVLKYLDISATGKIAPGTLQITNAKEDTSSMDSGKDTLSNPSSSDSEDIPLSQIFNQD